MPEVRQGRSISKTDLIARYGADIRLPDLREEISQCKRRGQLHDACMVAGLGNEVPDTLGFDEVCNRSVAQSGNFLKRDYRADQL